MSASKSRVKQVRRAFGRHGRAALLHVPPAARLRIRQVKRAALGQPPPPDAADPVLATAPERPCVPIPPPTPIPPTPPAAAPSPTTALSGDGPQRAPDGISRAETRRSHIYATARRGGRALEIGPAHNGTLRKRDGYDTRTVDYLDRVGLIEKYQEHKNYSPDDIEDVDYVLPPGAAMSDVITDRFDLVLASHVIEHTTSLIDFLNECTRLLNPGGVLALVVPDHRYCFDRFRERSSIGSVIDASISPTTVHTVGTLTEFSLYAVRHRGTTSWAPQHWGKYSLVHSPDAVVRNAQKATTGRYVDVHHWVFTPNHLRLMLNDLADLGYLQVREAYWHDTIGHEFFINLTAESNGPGVSRIELMQRSDDELRHLDIPEWDVDD